MLDNTTDKGIGNSVKTTLVLDFPLFIIFTKEQLINCTRDELIVSPFTIARWIINQS